MLHDIAGDRRDDEHAERHRHRAEDDHAEMQDDRAQMIAVHRDVLRRGEKDPQRVEHRGRERIAHQADGHGAAQHHEPVVDFLALDDVALFLGFFKFSPGRFFCFFLIVCSDMVASFYCVSE